MVANILVITQPTVVGVGKMPSSINIGAPNICSKNAGMKNKPIV